MSFILHRTLFIALLSLGLSLFGCQYLPGKTVVDNTTARHALKHKEAIQAQDDVPSPEKRALQLEQQQQNIAALDEWLAQTPQLMDDAAIRANCRNVWRVLSQMRNEEFSQLLRRQQAQLSGGWIALAKIQRLGASDLEKQAEQLQDWQRSWPLHPANRYLPDDMKLLRRLKEDQPRHIALLLPFSGKHANVGKAVRDGFLASYYRGLAAGAPAIRIDMIDSNSSPDILALYGAAVADGAQLVIGPVERERVQVLANEPSLAVPLLALNEASEGRMPDGLYQFSLNPEEEARQAANAAWAAQFKRALVIASDDARGQRLTQSFTRQWESLGGTVAATTRFNADRSNYNAVVEQVVKGTDSANSTQRRQDIDMIFLVGRANDASQILPALAFHYADDLPVYGLSQIYNPQQTLRSNDLDGIRLCLSPWQAGKGVLTGEIQRLSPPAAGVDQLYAMGADAQQLYLRLALMQANPNLTIDGYTGYLKLDAQRRIERGLVWMIMQNGQPAPLPDIAQ